MGLAWQVLAVARRAGRAQKRSLESAVREIHSRKVTNAPPIG